MEAVYCIHQLVCVYSGEEHGCTQLLRAKVSEFKITWLAAAKCVKVNRGQKVR